MRLITAVKFLAWDLIETTGREVWIELNGILFNRAVVTGILVAASLIVISGMARRRWRGMIREDFQPTVTNILTVMSAVVVLATGTFEIARVFVNEPWGRSFADPRRAMHAFLSVFWSVNASVLLAIGFARFNAALRVTAILCFAVTIVKVMTVDLGYLKMIYRIVSFMVLGLLLLGASLMYQKLSARVGAARAAESS